MKTSPPEPRSCPLCLSRLDYEQTLPDLLVLSCRHAAHRVLIPLTHAPRLPHVVSTQFGPIPCKADRR